MIKLLWILPIGGCFLLLFAIKVGISLPIWTPHILLGLAAIVMAINSLYFDKYTKFE